MAGVVKASLATTKEHAPKYVAFAEAIFTLSEHAGLDYKDLLNGLARASVAALIDLSNQTGVDLEAALHKFTRNMYNLAESNKFNEEMK